jgi:ATP-dependent DNA helicase RecG
MASISKLLLPLGIRVELLTGSLPASKKKSIKDALTAGHIDIIIGTHAIIQDDIEFHNLKLAIIDEQHKFGVKQRAFFQHHNSPHLLQMTATPIPRSLALAFFGEFTVSIIDEMPAGRKPIITKIISESEYHKLKPRILTKISQWQRVYVITSLIDESEQLDEVKSAKAMYDEITDLYPEMTGKIWLLHGQMKSKEKDEVMLDFKRGKYVILVSTTVIEVGIDVPEATVMIIKNAERFGLSQLHQIRGRVGRSDLQSYCFLETKNKNGPSGIKLKHLETTTDGFALAEIDLQMRGSGEFLGTRQSGESTIPAHILTDTLLLEQVKTCALQLLTDYPDLQWLDILHHQLQSKLSEMLV